MLQAIIFFLEFVLCFFIVVFLAVLVANAYEGENDNESNI